MSKDSQAQALPVNLYNNLFQIIYDQAKSDYESENKPQLEEIKEYQKKYASHLIQASLRDNLLSFKAEIAEILKRNFSIEIPELLGPRPDPIQELDGQIAEVRSKIREIQIKEALMIEQLNSEAEILPESVLEELKQSTAIEKLEKQEATLQQLEEINRKLRQKVKSQAEEVERLALQVADVAEKAARPQPGTDTSFRVIVPEFDELRLSPPKIVSRTLTTDPGLLESGGKRFEPYKPSFSVDPMQGKQAFDSEASQTNFIDPSTPRHTIPTTPETAGGSQTIGNPSFSNPIQPITQLPIQPITQLPTQPPPCSSVQQPREPSSPPPVCSDQDPINKSLSVAKVKREHIGEGAANMSVIDSSIVEYNIDAEGFLRDDSGNHILDDDGKPIKLTDAQIQFLQANDLYEEVTQHED